VQLHAEGTKCDLQWSKLLGRFITEAEAQSQTDGSDAERETSERTLAASEELARVEPEHGELPRESGRRELHHAATAASELEQLLRFQSMHAQMQLDIGESLHGFAESYESDGRKEREDSAQCVCAAKGTQTNRIPRATVEHASSCR
jgi:hypothetical protein